MPRKRNLTPKNEPARLINISELAREMGITESAIRGKIAAGYWVENMHFFRRGRRLMMDPDACKKWWSNQ